MAESNSLEPRVVYQHPVERYKYPLFWKSKGHPVPSIFFFFFGRVFPFTIVVCVCVFDNQGISRKQKCPLSLN